MEKKVKFAAKSDMDSKLIFQIGITVIVVIITLVYFLLRLRRASRRGILITGVCDSGKTLIFSRLAHNTFINTHTSIKENLAHYKTGKAVLQLIDIPGHERVRNKYIDEYKTSARAMIYVVDSQTLQKEVKDVAEYLYNLLTDKELVQNCKSILVLCNKQDVPMAKDSKVIQTLLEKELNTLRETKASQLSSTDENSSESKIPLGNLAQEFDFSQISPARIQFAESCAIDTDDSEQNLDDLKNWLRIISI